MKHSMYLGLFDDGYMDLDLSKQFVANFLPFVDLVVIYVLHLASF